MPIINTNTHESIGVLALFNKIKYHGFNEDEKSIADLISKFLSGIISNYQQKELVENIEYR